jgi:KaiC/GvpD/RAD55 family RecA-like ATPase
MGELSKPARARAGEKIPSGILGLDDVLGGGLRRNRLYLALGDPGVGKTTMALGFLLAGVANGERVLYTTLSETHDELVDIAESHGLSLEGIEVLEFEFPEQAAGTQTMFHPAEIDLEEFTAPLLAAVERLRPARVVLDSLSELRVLAQDERRFRRQIVDLKDRFAALGATALLLDDRTPGDLMAVPSTFAHGVLVLESGRVRVVQVDPAELSPGHFASVVRDAVDRGGARLVILDSLNGYLSSTPEETFLPLHVHELITYLGQRGVTSLITLSQHGVLGQEALTGVDVSYLADTVIMLRFFEAEGEIRKAISVPKMRSGFHDLTLREYRIDEHGLRVGVPLREFQGVLTGTPTYVGNREPLLDRDGNAAAP